MPCFLTLHSDVANRDSRRSSLIWHGSAILVPFMGEGRFTFGESQVNIISLILTSYGIYRGTSSYRSACTNTLCFLLIFISRSQPISFSRPFLIFSLSFSFDPHCRQAFLCFEARQEVLKPIERSTAAARKSTPRAPQSATTNANAQQQDNISHKGTARK